MQRTKEFLKKWSKKKRFYIILILVALILFFTLKPKVDESVSVDTVKLQDLESTVAASGVVTSSTDLSLSFNSSGVVRNMYVKVGDKVEKGKILATLDSASAYGSLQSAQGALKAAKAKYEKLLQGASNEEINLAFVALQNAEIDLENTKAEQDVLVYNARQKLLSSGLEAVAENTSTAGTAPIISGTYNGKVEGSYLIKTSYTGGGTYFSVSGLSTSSGPVDNVTRPLGSDGLYVSFPSGFSTNSSGGWVVNIPNKQSSDYLTNLGAYNAALETRTNQVAGAQATVDAKSAELALKRAKARSFELDGAQADILSAEGNVQSAQAVYENTIIRAPAGGTITQVQVKLGEQAVAQKEAIVLEDIDNLYLEASINEANIVKVKLGQPVAFSIDSFGPLVKFSGEVVHIDPGATTTDGIVNYKIKISLKDLNTEIRPGMNADLKILIDKKPGVLVVPKLAISEHDGKAFARVITNEKTKKYEEKEVTLGIAGDGNLVEITSGLKEGEKVAVLSKTP